MGVTNLKVGDKIVYEWNRAFVGRVVKDTGKVYERSEKSSFKGFGILWEKAPDSYVYPELKEGLYHSIMWDKDLILLERFTPEYPEDGTWV